MAGLAVAGEQHAMFDPGWEAGQAGTGQAGTGQAGPREPADITPPDVAGNLAALHAAVDALADVDFDRVHPDDLGGALTALGRARNRLQGLHMRGLAVFNRRRSFEGDGASNTAAWLQQRQRMGAREASRHAKIADDLDELASTDDALTDGDIGPRHAEVITDAMRRARSHDLDTGARRKLEARLVAAAKTMDAHRLKKFARRLEIARDPAGAKRDAARQFERRRARTWRTRDGMIGAEAFLPPDGGEILRTALDALMTPDPDDVAEADRRSHPQRCADALVELARRALNGGSAPDVGGQRAQVLLFAQLETLAGHFPGLLTDRQRTPDQGTEHPAAVPELSHTGPVPHETARRICCDASICRIVTDGPSQPLDVGRAVRTPPAALRRAVIARDRVCRKCGAPPAWCDAHHIIHWTDGGPTALFNLLLLCRRCHHDVHEGGWKLRFRDNVATFTAPDGTEYVRPPP